MWPLQSSFFSLTLATFAYQIVSSSSYLFCLYDGCCAVRVYRIRKAYLALLLRIIFRKTKTELLVRVTKSCKQSKERKMEKKKTEFV